MSESEGDSSMNTDLDALKPVHVDDEDQFGRILTKVLSPSKPLQSPEYLRGRDANLTDIRRALYADGRHVFIHGYKGVGKTSLAQTAAFQLQSSDADPIIFGCGEGTTFDEAIREIVRIGLGEDPRVARGL
jgi:MoxR-like ATPase